MIVIAVLSTVPFGILFILLYDFSLIKELETFKLLIMGVVYTSPIYFIQLTFWCLIDFFDRVRRLEFNFSEEDTSNLILVSSVYASFCTFGSNLFSVVILLIVKPSSEWFVVVILSFQCAVIVTTLIILIVKGVKLSRARKLHYSHKN